MTDKPHTHDEHDSHHKHHGDTNDYLSAVTEYRKTFASKQNVIDNTPDPAVRKMLLRIEQIGCDNSSIIFLKKII